MKDHSASLHVQCKRCVKILVMTAGHEGSLMPVGVVVFSPDGECQVVNVFSCGAAVGIGVRFSNF